MVEETTYRRFHLNFLRIHRQAVMGNERRYFYDYYMLCCGPIALTDRVALCVAGAARDESHGDWRLDMHQPAIVIGTADILVSKLLLRGYDTGVVMHPIDFGLLLDERPSPKTYKAVAARCIAAIEELGREEKAARSLAAHAH